MSYSRRFTKLHIKIAFLITRLTGWLQSGDMKKNKPKGELSKAKILTNYFARKYFPAIKNLEQQPISAETPEIIWQFWDNQEGRTTPEIIKASIESVDKFKGNFEHRVLNNSTIGNYSDLPGYVFDKLNKKQISYALFSDLLRLNLLKNHGGIWMDATLYMTDFVPENIKKQPFFVFLTDKRTHYPYSFMQNFFICSQKGNFLCEAWYQMCVEYWKGEERSIDYFQHQLMFKALVEKNPVAKKLFAEMPHISEDEVLQFVGDNLFKKFDANEWEKIRKSSFFQKTSYRVFGGSEVANPADYPDSYFSKICERKL